MLDREGFRPNVGIILLNAHNEVFWGKRLREHSWQFPQGGIKYGETPVQAMYRELHEETGLLPEHVKVVGRTRDWLRYEVPDKFIKREVRGHYRGQKQIWFLLRMVGRDCDICLRATDHPEFDAWRWNDYWVPLDCVIEFKRDVYQLALTELSRFLRRAAPRAEKPGGHHGQRYPRMASSVNVPPGSGASVSLMQYRSNSSRARGPVEIIWPCTSVAARNLARPLLDHRRCHRSQSFRSTNDFAALL